MVLPGSGDTVTVGGVYADTTASGLATGTCEDFTITHWLVVFGTATSTQDYHSCDGPYVWNGMTLSSDTTVDWSTTLANGCDSTATLNFTIGEDSPVSSEAITSQGPWTACDGTVYDVSGLYTINCGPNAEGCDSIVTVALTVDPLSVDEVSSNVNIYPNPTRDGAITVELGTLTDVSVRVSNLVGEVVYQDNNISTPTYKLNINEAAGVYFVEVSNAADKKVFKLLVE